MGAKFQFTKGMEVEICSDDQGLRGAWFVGRIIQSIPRKKKALVEYNTLNTSEEEGSKQLKEFVNLINLRPIPPQEIHCRFNFSDEVDAYYDDAWWEGIVTRVIEKDRIFRYVVYFRTGKEEIEFGEDELRVHREWVHGNWVPPLEEKAKESIDGDCNQIGDKSDKTQLPLVSNIDDIARTTSIKVHEAILSKGTGPCSDPVASRWQSSNLDDLSCSNSTADIATDVDTLEEAMKQLTSERNDIEILSPCRLNEADMMEGSPVLIAQVEQATPSTPTPEEEETYLQSKKEITQNMSAIISSPSQQLKQPTSERNDNEISSPCRLNEADILEGSPVLIAQVEQATPSTPTPEEEETYLQSKKEITQNMSAIISSPSQQLKQPTSERNDTEISSPCQLNEADMMEGSPVLIAQVEQATPSTPTPEEEETYLQNKKEITQNMSAIILSPLQQLNDHLAPNSAQGETGIVTDCDMSKCQSVIIIDGPCNAETQVQSLEQNHTVHAVDRQDQQPCLEAGWLCPETSVDGNEHPEKLSLPEPKVDKEKKKRRLSQTSCPNNLMEERKKRPSQQCPKLPEPFIPSDEQQQCRRTGKGWRCSTMAFPRKRYCEKHEIEQNVRNQKRRKRPIEITGGTMEPFQPSDPQQCRRSGKGWRCRAMASSGKRYCDKHQLEQNIHNEKRRNKRKLGEEPCVALDMDMNGSPDQGDAVNMLQIDNNVECTVNMQCEIGRSDSGNVAMSSEVDPGGNEQADTEPIQEEAEVVSVDISNESETKKRMTGAFFDEFWPVFIT